MWGSPHATKPIHIATSCVGAMQCTGLKLCLPTHVEFSQIQTQDAIRNYNTGTRCFESSFLASKASLERADGNDEDLPFRNPQLQTRIDASKNVLSLLTAKIENMVSGDINVVQQEVTDAMTELETVKMCISWVDRPLSTAKQHT